MEKEEKVIKGLEEILDYFRDVYRNDTDSYKCEKAQEYSDVAVEAIALLKKEHEEMFYPDIPPTTYSTCYLCGNCKIAIFPYGAHYCHNCGRKVKWND